MRWDFRFAPAPQLCVMPLTRNLKMPMPTKNSQKLSDKDFKELIDKAPLVSIDIIVQNNKGEVLVGLRTNKPAQNYWFVPGGRILKNEKLEEAFVRITSNELNADLEFNNAQLIGVFDHLYDDNKFGAEGINTHYVSIAYKIILSQDHQIAQDEQHKEFKWLSVTNLLQDNSVHDNTKMFFRNFTEMTREEAVKFWREQSNLMWSRIQTAAVVEAGGLTGWYHLFFKNTHFGFFSSLAVLGLSGLLLLVISVLMKRDAQYMDRCGEIAGNKLPRTTGKPLFGWNGRKLAIGIPLALGEINILVVLILVVIYWEKFILA